MESLSRKTKMKTSAFGFIELILPLLKYLNTPWTYIRTNSKFDGPIFGGVGGGLIYGGLIFGRKSTSIYNMLNLLFFLYSSIKHVPRHFSHRAR